ncbi:hypothetical protein MLD38_036227 [Melastoma candidum]|uniref:Uncharacterized protein n=1 Tax=Melastoma candidum TaxID=119954 RepID=A0ACB9LJ10_9MYRT|nr:hypothetical protein MLD38_036227 [Melastoma candidum]
MPARDLVSWNTVIAGNVLSGMYDVALAMVRKMGLENIGPDAFTLSSMLPMCAEYAGVVKAKEIHWYAVRHGIHDNVVIGSSLIDAYAKCTRIQDFFSVFNGLPRRGGITWNSMIVACVQNGLSNKGFEFFRCMVKDNLKPGPLSFSSIIPACSHLTSLIFGKQLHGYIIRTGLHDNVFIASSLVDMYAKCGRIGIAKSIFSDMMQHDLGSWTAIIMGCALHGQALDALKLFNEMEVSGVRPSYVSFIAILTACSHAVLVEEARKYYDRMIREFGITPGVEHYAAMADLLGRSGRVEEAYDFMCKMPAEPPGSLWSALLNACRIHKNEELAEKVSGKILAVDPENIGAYIIMSNIYSSARQYEEAATMRVSLRKRGFTKKPACSWIEVRNKLYSFFSGDKSHPSYVKISKALKVLYDQIEKIG